jgi:hypothetical protein
VIGKSKIRLRPNPGHVTGNARSGRDCSPVHEAGVTGFANGVINGDARFEWRMGRVTGHASESARAFAKTTAGRKQQRLVTGVPGILQIGGVPCRGGHAMAVAAKAIQVIRGEFFWIGHWRSRRVGSVRGRRTVTRFAVHAGFVRQDGIDGGKGERAGGMAAEAAHNGCAWIEYAIRYAARIGVAGSERESVDGAVPAPAHFGVIDGVRLLYEGDGLCAGPERPLARLRGV